MLLADILIAYRKGHTDRLASFTMARAACKWLLAELGHIDHEELSDDDLVRYEKSRAHVAIGTLSNELGVLRAALNYAVMHRRIPASTVPKIATPGRSPCRTRWLSREEARVLLAAAKALEDAEPEAFSVYTYCMLGLFTGQRPNVILSLPWSAVDWRENIIDFRPAKHRGNKKYGRVKMMPELRAMLESEFAKAPTGFVLKRRLNHQYQFKRAVRLAGLRDVTPYVLRHTFATWSIDEIGLWELSNVMGTSMKTLEAAYLHTSEKFQKAHASRTWNITPRPIEPGL